MSIIREFAISDRVALLQKNSYCRMVLIAAVSYTAALKPNNYLRPVIVCAIILIVVHFDKAPSTSTM